MNSQPSRFASRMPIVVFPAPVTPINTTITRSRPERKGSRSAAGANHSSHFAKFRYPARFHPLHNEDVARVVKACAMRTDEPAGYESPWSLPANGGPVLTRVFSLAQAGNRFVLAIKNYHLAQKVRYH